jgi:hypothetical protein
MINQMHRETMENTAKNEQQLVEYYPTCFGDTRCVLLVSFS